MYSVEVDEAEAAGTEGVRRQEAPLHKRGIQEMIRSIDVAADFEEQHVNPSSNRSIWVAFKLVSSVPGIFRQTEL